jgi:hypothetical protein
MITTREAIMPFIGEGSANPYDERAHSAEPIQRRQCPERPTRHNGNPAADGPLPGHQVRLREGPAVDGIGQGTPPHPRSTEEVHETATSDITGEGRDDDPDR